MTTMDEIKSGQMLSDDDLDKVTGGAGGSGRETGDTCPSCGCQSALMLSKSKRMCSNCGATFNV